MSSSNKICILVIDGTSVTNHENYNRWSLEQHLWKLFADSFQNIDVYFLKCNNHPKIHSNTYFNHHHDKVSKLFNDRELSNQVSHSKISEFETDSSIKVEAKDLPEFAFPIQNKLSVKDINTIKIRNNLSIISKNVLQCDCEECLIPGIFQKTVIALHTLLHKYDVFIRTNLSTIFFETQLIRYCEKYRYKNYPIYEGSHIDKFYNGYQYEWAMGHSIFLNKYAAKILIHEGMKTKYFTNTNTPDDVLIAYILLSYDVKAKHTGVEMYKWNPHQSIQTNINYIHYNNIPYVRTKFMTDTQYTNLINFFYQKQDTQKSSNPSITLKILKILFIIISIVISINFLFNCFNHTESYSSTDIIKT